MSLHSLKLMVLQHIASDVILEGKFHLKVLFIDQERLHAVVDSHIIEGGELSQAEPGMVQGVGGRNSLIMVDCEQLAEEVGGLLGDLLELRLAVGQPILYYFLEHLWCNVALVW